MKNLGIGILSGALVLLLAVGDASAAILNFDDLSTPYPQGTFGNVGPSYGGLLWDNVSYVDGTHDRWKPTGYGHGVVSEKHVAFNALGYAATVSDGLFYFNGVYLTGAWRNGLNVTIKGYVDTGLKYEKTFVVDTAGPLWADFTDYIWQDIEQGSQAHKVNKLVFTSSGGTNAGLGGDGTHFVLDDFTFNEPVIPEPASLVIWGLLAVGCGTGVGWRRKLAA